MSAADLMPKVWLATVLWALTTAASAQVSSLYSAPKSSALPISGVTLAAVMKCVPAKDGKPQAFSARLVTDTTYSASLIRLLKPDAPHAHGAWSEIYLVERGAGVMQTGGKITGASSHDSATHRSMFLNASCWRRVLPGWTAGPAPAPMQPNATDESGTRIEGGTKRRLEAGDMLLIPAGVPHRWSQVDGSVLYLDIKFPKAQ